MTERLRRVIATAVARLRNGHEHSQEDVEKMARAARVSPAIFAEELSAAHSEDFAERRRQLREASSE